MMRSKIKIAVCLIVMILAAIMFISCERASSPNGDAESENVGGTAADSENGGSGEGSGGTNGGTNGGANGGTNGGSSGLPEGEEQKMMTLVKNSQTQYKVVGGSFDSQETLLINSAAVKLSQKTGANFQKVSDSTSESAFEIVIGRAKREISQNVYSELHYSEYCAIASNGKICIAYYETDGLKKALNLFLEKVTEADDGSWEIPENLNLKGSLSSVSESVPKSADGDAALTNVMSCGAGNRMATFEDYSEADVTKYLILLQSSGFSRYSSNEISGNKFYVYTKGNCQVTLYWYPSMGIFKIIYGTKGYLPANEKGTVASVCTPSITQLARLAADESAPNGAPGMGYVIQLSDGRYIIIDGGPVDVHKKDVDALYDFLVANKPASMSKPVIAAWFITHAHIDHTELTSEFLYTYAEQVEIETFAHQFPDFSAISMTEKVSDLQDCESLFKAAVFNCARETDTLILHTGQSFWIGDANIEILFTPENHAPANFPTGNHTSIAFRIKLGNKTIMILGDSEVSNCKFMSDAYGSYLKSDILQVTHHGVNGGYLELYRAINPATCFWAIDEYRFNNHTQIRGSSAWDYNKWILDDSNGVRTHYHASQTTKINLT